MEWDALLNPATMGLMIPILVILGGIVHSVMKHRERMAMIAQGMNPDQFKIDAKNSEVTKHGPDSRR